MATMRTLQQHSTRSALRCEAAARPGLGGPKSRFTSAPPMPQAAAGIRPAPLSEPIFRRRTVTIAALTPEGGGSSGSPPPPRGGKGGSDGGSGGFWPPPGDRLPQPPEGFTWGQVYVAALGVGIVTAFSLSPIPNWIQAAASKISNKVQGTEEHVAREGREFVRETSDKAREVRDTTKDKARDAADKVRDTSKDVYDKASEKKSGVVSQVSGTASKIASDVKSEVGAAAESAKAHGKEFAEKADVENVKGKSGDLFASVGRALHIVPEEGEKKRKETGTAVKKAADDVEQAATEAKEWYKRWQVYVAGGVVVGLTVAAVTLIVTDKLDKGDKSGGGVGKKVQQDLKAGTEKAKQAGSEGKGKAQQAASDTKAKAQGQAQHAAETISPA